MYNPNRNLRLARPDSHKKTNLTLTWFSHCKNVRLGTENDKSNIGVTLKDHSPTDHNTLNYRLTTLTMRVISQRSLALLLVQLSLLLVLKHDQVQAFGVGGISATENAKYSIPVRSASAFARTGTGRRLSNAQPSPVATIRPRKTSSDVQLNMDIVGVSPEPIHTAFSFATFGPQPFWLLMILLPNNEITKKVMGRLGKIVNTWSDLAFVL